MGVSPQTGPPKFKIFNLLSYANEIFKLSKHKEKIKFDRIWGYQNGDPPNEPAKIQNIFNHTR